MALIASDFKKGILLIIGHPKLVDEKLWVVVSSVPQADGSAAGSLSSSCWSLFEASDKTALRCNAASHRAGRGRCTAIVCPPTHGTDVWYGHVPGGVVCFVVNQPDLELR